MFKCNTCSKSFAKKSLIRAHIIRMHSSKEKEHLCQYCPKLFKTLGDLLKHERTHKKEKNFVCEYCAHSCTNNSDLSRHIKTQHVKDPKLHECNECKKKFKDKSNLAQHEKICGKDVVKEFRCDFEGCGQSFFRQSNLTQHLNRHSQPKNIKCLVCSMKFKTEKDLNRHKKETHLGMVYECQKCMKTFKRKYLLKNHMTTKHSDLAKEPCSSENTEERKICNFCNIKFSDGDRLLEHELLCKKKK